MLLENLSNVATPIALFLAIPVLWSPTRYRRIRGLFHWLGVRPANGRTMTATLVGTGALMAVRSGLIWLTRDPFWQLFRSKSSVTGPLLAIADPVERSLVLILAAVFKTALSEELLFRGFLSKRFIACLGLWPGSLAFHDGPPVSVWTERI